MFTPWWIVAQLDEMISPYRTIFSALNNKNYEEYALYDLIYSLGQIYNDNPQISYVGYKYMYIQEMS